MISQATQDKVTKRLACDEVWRESALGKALALTVDLKVVSLLVMADYLLLKPRTLYRLLDSKSGQPQMLPQHFAQFENNCTTYQTALQAAFDTGAFEDFGNWFGHRYGRAPREEALRILMDHTPETTTEQ